MLTRDLEQWFESVLSIEAYASADNSRNGLQIGRPDKDIRRVAFSVDACAETIARAAERGADALFVHHGMIWGEPVRLTGARYARIKALVEADMALFACHLPLDLHAGLGNNAELARLLGLANREPFGEYHGLKIGFKGTFAEAIDVDTAAARLMPEGGPPVGMFAFGKKLCKTAAIVSGGAADLVTQAIREDIDLYVTGEPSHTLYHVALEAGINMLCLGHYASETWGVKALAERLAREKGLETFFVDVPTGL